MQQMAHVHFGTPGAFSDHSPSTVQLGLREPHGKRNFKFFNMWTAHPQFLETISQNWSLDVYGTHMYILCKKLKQLKGGLKSLNNLHFSHILEKVARAEKVLDDTQLLLRMTWTMVISLLLKSSRGRALLILNRLKKCSFAKS
jgi:hypothetical protein